MAGAVRPIAAIRCGSSRFTRNYRGSFFTVSWSLRECRGYLLDGRRSGKKGSDNPVRTTEHADIEHAVVEKRSHSYTSCHADSLHTLAFSRVKISSGNWLWRHSGWNLP